MSVRRLGDLLAKVSRPGKIPASEYLEEGEFPIIDQGQQHIAGYTNNPEIVIRSPLPMTIFGDHTRIVKFTKEPFACGADGTQLLYPNNNQIDPTFFYYAVKNIDLSNYFYARHFKFLKDQQIEIPENIIKQKRIASILSAYDDLIENNRRRIALLEQAARLLYREWFVHLRFPGHEHTPIIDGIPQGWEKKKYKDLFNFLNGYPFKSTTYQTHGRFGIVTIRNVHDAHFIPDCSSFLDFVPNNMKPHCFLSTGDILLSLTGNVGRACIVYGDGFLLNQRVVKIVGEASIPRSFVYWTFSNEASQLMLEKLAYGVAQLNLSSILLR